MLTIIVVLLVATCLVPLAVTVSAALLIWSRWRTRASLVVPVVVGSLASLVEVTLVSGFVWGIAPAFGTSDPATKATVLSLGLSEALNCNALFAIVALPLLLVAWRIDRHLMRAHPFRTGA